MKINKILNNNAIICERKDTTIVVAIGKGIGFQRKIGDKVDPSSIQKIFIQEEGNLEKLSNIFSDVSHKYIEVVYKIIEYSEAQLGKKFQSEIYYNLISHCQFAIERYFNGIPIINNIFWEIKNFYASEYKIGLKAVEFLNEEFNVLLNEEEAAFIAIHLIDAELGHDPTKVLFMTELIDAITRIIKYNLNIEKIEANEFDYARLVSHLRQFISSNLYDVEQTNYDIKENSDFIESLNMMKNKYKKIDKCIIEIENFILFKFNYKLSINDKFYMFIHLIKISKHST